MTADRSAHPEGPTVRIDWLRGAQVLFEGQKSLLLAMLVEDSLRAGTLRVSRRQHEEG